MTHRNEPLSTYQERIPTLAAWHFDYWGRLTGFASLGKERTIMQHDTA